MLLVHLECSFHILNFFGHVGKRLDKKSKVNFKIYEVTIWETNNYNAHIAKRLKKWR